MWARMLLGCVLVVATTAATVTTGVLLEVKSFTDALKLSPQLNLGNELATANPGGAQTILLIGSDKRAAGAVDASRLTRTPCSWSASTPPSPTRRCSRSPAT